MNPIIAALLGLAIFAVGALGYFETFGQASAGASAQNTTQVVQSVFSNVQQQFANNPNNFAGFNNTAAIQGNIVPAAWVPSGQSLLITAPWGGAVTFGAYNGAGGTATGWSMKIAGVPQSQCSQIASFYTAQTAIIAVGTTVVADNPNYGLTGTWPPQPAAVEAACANPTNTITWDNMGQ